MKSKIHKFINSSNYASSLPYISGMFFFIIYLLFPTRMHFGDGLYYAFHLEKLPISESFHPHHLLWLPIIHVIYDAFHFIIPSLRAMTFLQVLNAILGGLSVFLLIHIVYSITKNRIAGIIAGLALGLSWGMLHYAADANIYVPLLTLSLANFALIISGKSMSFRKAIAATLILVLISGLHQIGFFFSFAILASILTRSKKTERIKIAISCVVLYAIVNLCLYYAVFITVRHTLMDELQSSFVAWLIAYGRNRTYWSLFSLGFLGAQKAFDRSQFNLFFHIIDQNKAFYYSGYKESVGILVAYAFVQLIVLITILYELKKWIFRNVGKSNVGAYLDTPSDTTHHDMPSKWACQGTPLLLAWLIPFYIFNQFFCAFDVGYKLFYLAPLIVIWTMQIIEASARIKSVLKIAIPIILIGMAGWNFYDGVIPDTKPENNPYFKDVLTIMPVIKENDLLIFTEDERYISALIRAYTKTDSVFIRKNPHLIPSKDIDLTRTSSQSLRFLFSRYNRILVSNSAWESPTDEWYLPEHLFAPPRPDVVMIYKSDLLLTRDTDLMFKKSPKVMVIKELTD